jgi:Tfp pilus assembly protein PilO
MKQLGWRHAVTKLKEDKQKRTKQYDLRRQVNQKKKQISVLASYKEEETRYYYLLPTVKVKEKDGK